MEYRNFSLTKLISFLLVLALSCSLFACSDYDEISGETSSRSEMSGNDTSAEQNPELTVSEAKALIERDKKLIEIFACNALCRDSSSAEYMAVSDSEFSDFSAIEALLKSTYVLSDDNDAVFFSQYPIADLPSVKNVDGKTYAFYHPNSVFSDFIDMETVYVTDGETDNKKVINAKTLSGVEVVLDACFADGKWLLEHSLRRVYQPEYEPCTDSFPLSNLGSMSSFSGNILVIELFISDNGASFTPEPSDDEVAFHQKIVSAVDYVKSYADVYGTEVNVEFQEAHFEHDGTIGSGDLPFDLVFGETGFGSLQKFTEETIELDGYDNYVFAVCFNKECEPLFKAYENTKETELYYAERMFVGTNTTEPQICASLLSVLGAYSFREGLYDSYTEALYQAYFPYDIMSSETLAGTELTPVAAYSCGITEELKPLYRVFLNNQEKSEEQ